ncbi:MAG: hypothetical protein RLZZ450_1797 [Pseudomonadota bacterium]|jgi:predicted dithiol-disulfide oxidoreductase (DUF899 family)
MTYKDQMAQMAAYRREIVGIRKRMATLSALVEPEPVRDYTLSERVGSEDNRVALSSLFGRHRELFVIHSMGINCAYCTAWADGYNGVYTHLASRAAFCIVGPDEPAAQHAFARERGWRFRLLSHRGTSFADELGYRSENGNLLPGLSVLRLEGTKIVRTSDAPARPGDDFSPLCRLMELLPGGWESFTPKISYPDED